MGVSDRYAPVDDGPLETFENPPAERLSDVDGFSIVPRAQHRPRVHLLRPYPECRVPDDAVRVEGSREQLAHVFDELGYRRGGVACRRCFPRRDADDREELEEEED